MTVNISPREVALLQTYPLLVTGQIVPEIDSAIRTHQTTPIDGTTRATNRRLFARLHHTTRFGVLR